MNNKKNHLLYERMTRTFIVNEGARPSIISYIQSLKEILLTISPKTVTDSRRIEIARENIQNIQRFVKRLEEENTQLREKVELLEGKK